MQPNTEQIKIIRIKQTRTPSRKEELKIKQITHKLIAENYLYYFSFSGSITISLIGVYTSLKGHFNLNPASLSLARVVS